MNAPTKANERVLTSEMTAEVDQNKLDDCVATD